MSEIRHGRRGPNKRHKYVKIINGKYIYPEDLIQKGKDFVSDTKDSADINYRKARLKTKKAGRPIVRKIPRTIAEIESGGKRLKRDLNRGYSNYKNNRIIKRGAVSPIVKRANNESRIRQKNGMNGASKSGLEKHAENIVRINQRNGKFTNRKRTNNAVGVIANAARNSRRNTVRPNNYGYDRTTNYGRPKMNTASNAAERAFNSMKMPKVRKVKKSKLKEFMNNFKKKKKGQRIKTSDGDTRILSSTVRYR